MKPSNQALPFLLIIVMSFLSCSKNTDTKLPEEQKTKIINEIKEVWAINEDALEHADWEKAFSYFSDKEGSKYIRNGYLYPSIDSAKNEYIKGRDKNVGGIIETPVNDFVCDPMYFDIISKNTVIMTTYGAFYPIDTVIPDYKPWALAYTLVWTKEQDGWKILHMHNSWK